MFFSIFLQSIISIASANATAEKTHDSTEKMIKTEEFIINNTNSFVDLKTEIEEQLQHLFKEQEILNENPLCPSNSYIDLSLSNVDYPHSRYSTIKQILKGKSKSAYLPEMPRFDGILIQNAHPKISFTPSAQSAKMRGFAFQATDADNCQLKAFRLRLFKNKAQLYSQNYMRSATKSPMRIAFQDVYEIDSIVFDEIQTYGNQTTLCFPSFAACGFNKQI